jgi:hypothetical protein
VLYASTHLRIGADTMLAAQCYVGGGRYTVRGRTDVPISQQPEPRRGVVIEDDCWIGAGVVIVDACGSGGGRLSALEALSPTTSRRIPWWRECLRARAHPAGR